jgi:tetratricopeptide (TPR) repeat protein
VKRTQWLIAGGALLLVLLLVSLGNFTPEKKPIPSAPATLDASSGQASISIDTILALAKGQLTEAQKNRFALLQARKVTDEAGQLAVYHDMAHFWRDTVGIFEPYAWYEAEAARLEKSEKSLTFAARLFLDNLQSDENPTRRQWKALQAKDLFERSLNINPDNDSARVGLGACYLFGNVSANPMEGIAKIREVLAKDSTNLYAQLMLVRGSLLSGQYDKGISRLNTVLKLAPDNVEATLLMADLQERTGNIKLAIDWYQKSISLIPSEEIKAAIRDRINELNK